jgi:hypothetical protein
MAPDRAEDREGAESPPRSATSKRTFRTRTAKLEGSRAPLEGFEVELARLRLALDDFRRGREPHVQLVSDSCPTLELRVFIRGLGTKQSPTE